MTVLRRHLAWLVFVWLTVRVASVAAAPIAVWRAAPEHEDQECSCPIETGATCPMHHSSRSEDSTCKLRSAFGGADHAFLEPGGSAGLLPASTVCVSAFDPGEPVSIPSASVFAHAFDPDLPPPRG